MRCRRLLSLGIVASVFGAGLCGPTVEAANVPAGPLTDRTADVASSKGDVVRADFYAIGGWAISLNQFEDLTSPAWKSGATRIVINYDVDADKTIDYTVTLRILADGSPLALATNAKGQILCRDARNLRVHADQRQIGDSIYVGCFGFPKSWSAWGQLVRCDTKTGKVTTDRFPDSGWIGPFPGSSQPGYYPLTPSTVMEKPPACRKK